ncbi:MAG: glycosyltransferase, partial [Proteobacteria bacterium]|nr:glycosyltransferase [Pseudomonadota bacterium]
DAGFQALLPEYAARFGGTPHALVTVAYTATILANASSLAMGTPVVAGDGSAGRESVVDGETGLWFRQADVDDLAAKLTLMKDDARVTAMSNAAYRRYWDHPFSLDRHLNRIEEVYGELMARARR